MSESLGQRRGEPLTNVMKVAARPVVKDEQKLVKGAILFES
jgi:hypothetical protein